MVEEQKAGATSNSPKRTMQRLRHALSPPPSDSTTHAQQRVSFLVARTDDVDEALPQAERVAHKVRPVQRRVHIHYQLDAEPLGLRAEGRSREGKRRSGGLLFISARDEETQRRGRDPARVSVYRHIRFSTDTTKNEHGQVNGHERALGAAMSARSSAITARLHGAKSSSTVFFWKSNLENCTRVVLRVVSCMLCSVLCVLVLCCALGEVGWGGVGAWLDGG